MVWHEADRPWHEPSSTGFMVVETDDYQAVMKYCQQWNRTCHIEVTPVGTDADAATTLYPAPVFVPSEDPAIDGGSAHHWQHSGASYQ